jgi:hypothetical protein
MGLGKSDRSDRGDQALLTFFIKGGVLFARNYPHPFIFLGSSTPITPIAPIASFKLWILRCVFSDRGRLCGVTPRYTPIALIVLQVLILR